MALSENQIAQVWVNQGGDPKYAQLMAKIAKRESGGRPEINNRGTNQNGTVDWGLFQVNDIWRKDPVVGPLFKSGAILTPEGGAKAAVHILKVQGPKAWATYNPATDQKFLGGFTGAKQAPVAGSPATQPTTTRTVGAVDNSAQRGALIASFINQKGADPLQFAMGVRGLQDTPGQQVSTASPRTSLNAATPGSDTSKLVSRANAIDQKHMPYLWGGGHGGKVDPYNAKPLDCSGAVSAVLGINPRVAAQFEQWGKPGDGGSRGVTIYAKDTHVLMSINGHFWGTSASNPQGGAGWIPRSAISPQYLKGFVARHA